MSDERTRTDAEQKTYNSTNRLVGWRFPPLRTMLGIGLILLTLFATAAPVTTATGDECNFNENQCVGYSWENSVGAIEYEEEDATGVYVVTACAIRQDGCYDRDVVYFECNGLEGLQRILTYDEFGNKFEPDCRVLL